MNEVTTVRTPELIGAEIRTLTNQAKQMTLLYGIEIGRRLCEAKEVINHGEWLDYLKEQTEFSQPQASRMMRIFKEYGADQGSLFGPESKYATLTNLSISNALRLLAVPENEREEFAAEVDAEHISARELDEAIKARDEALKGKQDAEAKLVSAETARQNTEALNRELRDKLTAAQEDVRAADDEAAKNERELKARIKELESRPVEVAVERDEKAIEEAAAKAKEETETKFQKEIDALNKKLKKAEKEQEKAGKASEQIAAAEAETEKLRAEAEDLRKKLAMADTDITEFKVMYTAFQESFNTVHGKLLLIRQRDTDAAEKLTTAVKAALSKFTEAL